MNCGCVCMCAFDLIKPTTEKLPIMFHSFKDKEWTMRNHHIWESAQLETHPQVLYFGCTVMHEIDNTIIIIINER